MQLELEKLNKSDYEIIMSNRQKESGLFNDRRLGAFEALATGVGEFLATTVYVLVVCMGCIEGFVEGERAYHFQRSVVGGLAVMIAIQCFQHISGAHLNPITTICAMILKVTPLMMVPIYIAMQLLGATTGYGILKALTPADHFPLSTNSTPGICLPAANPQLSTLEVVGFELVLTSILTFANCNAFDPANFARTETIALKFGLLIATLITAAGPISGAVMNPARSFGPAVWNNDWRFHWIYWVAPTVASGIVSTFYRFLFMKPN